MGGQNKCWTNILVGQQFVLTKIWWGQIKVWTTNVGPHFWGAETEQSALDTGKPELPLAYAILLYFYSKCFLGIKS